jgi:transcriptional regulator with XRE-family HTH domain
MTTEAIKKLRAQKLQFLRESFGLSQARLIKDKQWRDCIDLNTLKDIHTYGDFEKGKRDLKDDKLLAIAEAFGIDKELLFEEWSLEDFKEIVSELGHDWQVQGGELPLSAEQQSS